MSIAEYRSGNGVYSCLVRGNEYSLESLLGNDSITEDAFKLLTSNLENGRGIIVTGLLGVGKTTLSMTLGMETTSEVVIVDEFHRLGKTIEESINMIIDYIKSGSIMIINEHSSIIKNILNSDLIVEEYNVAVEARLPILQLDLCVKKDLIEALPILVNVKMYMDGKRKVNSIDLLKCDIDELVTKESLYKLKGELEYVNSITARSISI